MVIDVVAMVYETILIWKMERGENGGPWRG